MSAKTHNPIILRVAIIAILLAVFGGYGWYIDAQRAAARSVLSGFFENQPTEIGSRADGRVARILVDEGDSVRAGQALVVLEAGPLNREVAAKAAQAAQARAQYREVKNGPRPEDIAKQRAVVAEQRADLARLVNGPLPEEIGEARARVGEAAAQYRKALAGSRPQEIASARAAAASARAHLAAVLRGPTAEEKAEARARLDSALAQESFAAKDAARMTTLFHEEAVTQQQEDQSQAALAEATANREDLEEAWRRAEEGTPPEETAQARDDARKAQADLDLALAGTRPEDVANAAATLNEARQALALVLRGSRQEDIAAARDRLAQSQSTLAELVAGSRAEDIAQSLAAQAAARAQAQESRLALAEHVIRAPIDGVVERVLVSTGDLLNAGTSVVRLADPKDVWLRVYVPEADLGHIAVGDDARLAVDGISQPVDGVVQSVDTQGEFTPVNLQVPDERGKQVFGVRIRPRRSDLGLKPGMYVTVKRIGGWVL